MAGHPIAELVRQRTTELSPAERRLAKVLLASYPIAGLESLGRLAERAAVSPPTVTRFIGKLGFRGYPEFPDRVRREVPDPLHRPPAAPPSPATSPARREAAPPPRSILRSRPFFGGCGGRWT